jgi:hypothetical protein
MKCPYKNFEDCIIEKCPSCNYELIKTPCVEGRYPSYMSNEEAITKGYAWESTKNSYKFISCKLIDGNVQPVLRDNNIVNNTNKTSINIRKSIF